MRTHRKIHAKNKATHSGRTGRVAVASPTTRHLYDLNPAQQLIARHRAVTYPYACSFGLAQLEIDEGVFCPTLTNVSPLLLHSVEFRPGQHVLDAFAGSGAFGINAALAGSTVVAVDVDPVAAACVRKNAAINGVGAAIEVRCGSMEHSLRPGERFDLIIANPPLLPGKQIGPLAVALFDPGLKATLDFLDSLPARLTPGGRCFLLTSDVLERYGHDVSKVCAAKGLTHQVIASADAGHESYRVHLVTCGEALASRQKSLARSAVG